MIQKSAKLIESAQRTNETREEIEKLVNGLFDLEYKKVDGSSLTIPTLNKFYSEDDFLGISKYASPNGFVFNKSSETQRFIDSLQTDITHDFFRSDEYLSEKKWQTPKTEISQSDSTCKCLQDFYNQHSKCS
jgi:hypothetical protein